MNQTTPGFASRRFRTPIAVLLAYFTLLAPLAPVAAQVSKVKRATAPITQSAGQTGKGKGTATGGSKQVTLPAPNVVGAAPVITATKTDSYPDPNSDGKADPGETITYTVTITNTGTADATAVQFNDTIDPNTTLVPGSVNTQPIAVADTYNVIGNVRIQPNAAQGLLANDRDPDTGNNTGLTASGPSTSTQGGNVTINADGSFSYNPAPGFAGTDTFTYTITDGGGKTDTAVATFNVGNGTATPGTNVVWFVDPSATVGGDGRLTHPFNCYTGTNNGSQTCFSATAADDPGDAIFLFSGAHTGGNTLLNTQKLIGAGASDTLANLAGLTVPTASDALPTTGGASPTITTTNVNAIPLGQGNLLRGFTVGNTGTGSKISGSGFGTLTVGNTTTPDVTLNGTGQALNLTNGSFAATSAFTGVTTTSSTGAPGISLATIGGTVSFGPTSVSNAGTQGISISGSTMTATFGTTGVSSSATQGILIGTTSGAISFGATTVTGGSDGVSLQNNSGANTRTFSSLSVSGGTGIAFLSGAGGGNVTVSGAATLSSAGNAIDIQSLTSGSAVSFNGATSATRTASGGTGVNLVSNSGSTLTFNSLAITTNAGTGLNATGGGTINVTNNTGAINSVTQAAPAIIANGVTLNANFSAINSSGGANGVSLTTVAGTSNFGTGALSGATGTEFLVSGGNPAVTYGGTVTQNNAQRVVDIQGTTGNTISFTDAATGVTGGASSLGVHIGDTTGVNGNVSFAKLTLGTSGARMTNQAVTIAGGTGTYSLGTISVFTSGAQGISATNADGTINVTTGTVDTTTNRAINISGPAGLTTLGVALTTVNSTSAPAANPNGITLTNTGGSFTVAGTGGACTLATTTCTGGSIQSANGAGILLNNVVGVSLTRMKIQNSGGDGIDSTSTNGFTFDNGIITDVNTVGTVNGTTNDCGIQFTNASGTVTISNSVIDQAPHDGIQLINTNTNMTAFNVTSTTVSNMPNSTTSNNGILVNLINGSTVGSSTITGSTFTGIFATGIQFDTNGNSVQSNLTVQTSHFTNNNIAMNFTQNGTGTATINILNNTDINHQNSNAINMATAQASTGGGITTKIQGNAIGTAGVKDSGSAIGIAIRLNVNGQAHFVGRIDSNTIREVPNARAIELVGRLGSGGANFKVTGNNIAAPTGTNKTICDGTTTTPCPLAPIYVEANSGNTVCTVISGNTTYNPQPIGFGGEFAYYLHEGSTAPTPHDINIENNGGDATATQAVTNHNTPSSPVQVDAGVTLVAAGTCGTFPSAAQTFDDPPAAAVSSQTTQPVAQAGNDITAAPLVALPAQLKPAKGEAQALAAAQLNVAQQQQQPEAPVSKTEGGAKTSSSKTSPVVITSGETVSVNIGTLAPNDSVTITFQVTVNNPYTGGPNVSNQGTVSGSNFSNVLTDDPAVAGAANPTLTPINSIHIRVNDAKAAEPTSGTTPMLFTVALSGPAPVGGLTVNYATADGGATPATGGAACDGTTVDYITASGTLAFAAGEQVRTIPVSICADTNNAETDETLLLNISGASSGVIDDAQAVGTITPTNTPGTFLISELRTSGPGGAGDDFVEFYNNTASPLTVTASDASGGYGLFKMGTDCSAAPVLIATIPNGTVIPAHGHYLVVGSQYGLGAYATGDQTMTSDIETDHNVAVFTTADVNALSSSARLDAVGFDGNTGGAVCDLLKEGNTLPPIAASPTVQHSFYRSLLSGLPQDTNDNATDFTFVDTQGTFISGVPQRLGAPGPENKTSPIQRTALLPTSLIDPCQSSSTPPNRVRDNTSNPGNNSTFGTLAVRRKFTNNTGANVTRLRFRIVDITTFPSPGGGVSDLRVLTSTNASGTVSPACGGGAFTVQGLTLDQPPNQPNGGGMNSSVTAGTVTLATPLAPGAAISVQFLLGVQTTGSFRFFITVEALP